MKSHLVAVVSVARKAVGLGLILSALEGVTRAGLTVPAAPEIDAGSLLSGLTVLSCGVLILTGRVGKKSSSQD